MRFRSKSLAVLGAGLLVASVGSGGTAQALNDPEYAKQWGLQITGTTTAWDAGLFGEGITIAVIDTGVHLNHQDLKANVVAGRNFVDPTRTPQDDNQHGTHVAGIAAAAIDNGGTVGVAPRARIMPIKVLGADGSGSSRNVSDGIKFAADNGAQVINLSLGAATQAVFGPSTVDAVRYAWSKGSICVFAAGNDFVLTSGFADEPALVVSSTSRQDTESDFSNGVGEAMWGIAAPGGAASSLLDPSTEDVYSTVWASDAQTNTYKYLAGTSMAAPHVAGAAALLRGAGLTPQQTVDRLLATAKDLGPKGRDSTFGAGRLDVARAVQGLSAGGAPPAPTPAPAPSPTATNTTAAPSGSPSSPPPSSTAASASRTATTTRTAAPGPTAAPSPVPTPDSAPTEGTETTLAPVEVSDEPVAIEPVTPSDDNELVALESGTKTKTGFDGWPWAALAAALVAATSGGAIWRRRSDRG